MPPMKSRISGPRKWSFWLILTVTRRAGGRGRALFGTYRVRPIALPTNHPSLPLPCRRRTPYDCTSRRFAGWPQWHWFRFSLSLNGRRNVSKRRCWCPDSCRRCGGPKTTRPLPRRLRCSDLPQRIRLRQVLQGEGRPISSTFHKEKNRTRLQKNSIPTSTM